MRDTNQARLALAVWLGCSVACLALLMLAQDLHRPPPQLIATDHSSPSAADHTHQANEEDTFAEAELDYGSEEPATGQLAKFEPSLVVSVDELERLSSERNLHYHFIRPNSTRLLHLNNVTYPIETYRSFSCSTRNLTSSSSSSSHRKLLIVINSKWSNFKRRQRLRASWLRPSSLMEQVCSQAGPLIDGFKYLFMVGRPGRREAGRERELELEAEREGDLVMVNLEEDYRALSMKHLSVFKWILGNHRLLAAPTQDDTLLLKCDDDAHIELGQLLDSYLLNAAATDEAQRNHGNWISCASFPEHTRSQRQPDRKWQLSPHEFPYDTFPAYCSGLAYLAPVGYARRLLLLAHLVQARGGRGGDTADEPAQWFERPLWVDDVFVTGLLPASLRPRARIYRLNADFCYTKALRLHRQQLRAPCMVSEIDEARE